MKKEDRVEYYNCSNCNTEWSFFPEDYLRERNKYPTKCPHCTISLWELIKSTYNYGLKEVLYWLKVRYIKKECS